MKHEKTTEEKVGYGAPPKSTQFQKGRSGNPRGRPRNRKREIPYDHVLSQMVSIREDGRERRVTAAEAFLLQLTRRGLQGDSASARASLAAIEEARAKRRTDVSTVTRIIWKCVTPGSVSCALDALGMAVKLRRYSEDTRHELKPWIVQMAIDRLGDKRLTVADQSIVLDATHSPLQVRWPEWWTVRP